jgi:hypothetical protein
MAAGTPPQQPRTDDAARAGLCATCVHAKLITSSRGSVFYLCQLSFTHPQFPRYPALPVLACSGYESH